MERKNKLINVDVVFASSSFQTVLELSLPLGSTVKDAIVASGILKKFPEIDLSVNSVGIFSKRCNLNDYLQDCDQVEIYRSLLCDPKNARRRRANLKSKK